MSTDLPENDYVSQTITHRLYDANVATKVAQFILLGVGDDDTPVQDCIHVCTPDEGSNMLKGWSGYEGAGCVCHRQQNCLGTSLEIEDIKPIIKKVKGVCAHFHRSDKVIYFCL